MDTPLKETDAGADLAIIVPARLESTRFPRKLLHPLAGRALLLRVADRIRQQAPEFALHFAVDHEELGKLLGGEGFSWLMTSTSHESGTDRLAEANRQIRASYVINVQADEPLITRQQISRLAALIRKDCEMATLATPFTSLQDFQNPNQVKVVRGENGQALYFSRAPIPYNRDQNGAPALESDESFPALRHLGLYAYRADFLDTISALSPSPLEKIEKLEQLRALENGYRIQVGITEEPTIGIDTPEDAAAYEASLAASEQ